MNGPGAADSQLVDAAYERLKKDAESGGYHLNPDIEFTRELVAGLLANEQRYGYGACPCRLASGRKDEDLDIICPCDYRDPDLGDYDSCYCGLYVSRAVVDGQKKIGTIPERRPPPADRARPAAKPAPAALASVPMPVWRCRVCGYLCARDGPPDPCPICKARKERFERFL